jgi:hypothetical protein
MAWLRDDVAAAMLEEVRADLIATCVELTKLDVDARGLFERAGLPIRPEMVFRGPRRCAARFRAFEAST